MMQTLKIIMLSLTTLMLLACEKADDRTTNNDQKNISNQEQAVTNVGSTNSPKPITLSPSDFKVIDWVDLMPKVDLDAFSNPPSYITNSIDGLLEEQISKLLESSTNIDSNDPYQQALVSTKIKPEMNGQPIKIPGFIVPLEFNDEQSITQFFLVPFFGACIHVPPPPPNQIIFVNYPRGLKQDALDDPFWVSGVLSTSLVENEIATAAYTLRMQSFEIYSEL